MEDGDGVRLSTCGEIENRPSTLMEEDDSTKPDFVRDPTYSSNNHSEPIKLFLGFNSVNGDCVEKEINQFESPFAGSSSNNSFSSESSEVTRDSSLDDATRIEGDSSSVNSSKSSHSDSPKKEQQSVLLPKSPLTCGMPPLSESSDDSDSSDSDNSEYRQSNNETPRSHEISDVLSLQSTQDLGDKDECKSVDCSSLTESDNSKKNSFPESSSLLPEKIIDFSAEPDLYQPSSVESSHKNKDCGIDDKNAEPTSFKNTLSSAMLEQTPLIGSSETKDKIKFLFEKENKQLIESDQTSSEPPLHSEDLSSLDSPVLHKPEEKESSHEKEVEPSLVSVENDIGKISEENLKQKDDQIDCPKTRSHAIDSLPKQDCIEKTVTKTSEKITKNSRRKTEERNFTACDNYNVAETFPIQYKGFKKIGKNLRSSNYNKSLLRWNPFNPCRKKDLKTGKYILQKSYRDVVDCSTLQPEYAQYLGLQPTLKFRCKHCGMSTFSSMSALNTHQIECKKNEKNIPPVPDNVPTPDLNSTTNFKLSRKVFLCSTCGTYYENCQLFLHMRNIHGRYICLFCLSMGHSPDSLLEHLKEKHNIENQVYSNLEELQKTAPPSFFLLCMTCNRVFTEMDDSCNHKCSPKSSHESDHSLFKRSRTDDSLPTSSQEPVSSNANDSSKIKALKLNKDIVMKPLNSSENASESCTFKSSVENCNQTPSFPQLSCENKGSHSFENVFSKTSLDNSENNSVTQSENIQIKIPSGIEIKPLIPGENNNQENKFEPTNGSSIEIFPIHTEPKKASRKVRTIIRRTKKKPLLRGKARFLNAVDNSIPPISEENECLEDNFFPPISPPIIAPPPVVADCPSPPSPLPKSDHSEKSPELADSEPQPQPEPPIQLETDQDSQPTEEQVTQSPSSAMDESSESSNLPENEGVQLNTPESKDLPEMKRSLSQDIFKIKLKGDIESDVESDDSQKLSLIVDENTNNSEDSKKDFLEYGQEQSERDKHSAITDCENTDNNNKTETSEIPLAREDIAAMALTLDDKIENVPIQAVVKECVRTSCLSCNYCRHAVKIAVNGKQLALHLLSEHRYTPVKNETNEDVVRKLKNSLETLESMHFNTETYDSSDSSLHIPYDKESNFDCFQCSYVSSSHKDLYAHKRKCHTKSLLLCIMCKKNFFSYSELICHICSGTYNAESQVYSVDINFRCCFCRLDTIPSAFRLMVHLRKSHHTCDICLEMCSDQQKLSTHMWKHKLSHLCYRCGIAYASKPDITKHLFWKHGTESVLCKKCLQKKWPHVYHFCIPPTSFICEECNTSFSKAVALKVHKRIHGNDYPYSCSQCEKKFVSKKLLARHIDRHNAVFQKKDSPQNSTEDNKEEIINVTDVIDSKETLQNDTKEDGRDKSHKKHKKEKDKKEKKVVDVYDLPPLNLSSESDSSDEESAKKNCKVTEENTGHVSSKDSFSNSEKAKGPDMPKLEGITDNDPYADKSVESSSFLNLLKPDFLQKDGNGDECDRKPTASEPVSPFDSSVVNSLLPLDKDDIKNEPDTSDSAQNDQVEGIWENFYKTNPQNSNLPFPLCAMKSDLAYRIIMGDHDYCNKIEPVIKEDLPSTSNLETNLSDDKLEEVTPLKIENTQTPPLIKEENPSTPPSISKKKVKSPKKKLLKTPDDNNSSSSSDSSSDSDSSCSCGTNCSCCSSSSSSSSSSSDSDSSTNEDKKSDKRKKKKEKRALPKSDCETEPPKEIPPPEPEIIPLPEPEDPPIRESELDTDESTSDEEFYDRQPQIIANQMLAEKRQMQIASGAVNDVPPTTAPLSQTTPPPPPSPLPPPPPPPPPSVPQSQENIPPPDIVQSPKPKPRTKRKRRVNTPKTPKAEKPLMDSNFPRFANEPKSSPFSLFQQTPPASKQKPTLPVPQSPSLPEASGSGSETDSTRLSKRRRVPNKFYGYSSGDEEEKQLPKWRKIDVHLTPNQPPKIPIIAPPPTPRIQLTVPKQIIRKPYHKQPSKTKVHSSTESSDSAASDVEEKVSRPQVQPTEQVKTDKDVYCYCRCPYDEVSEMIACDDANCKIEWFHFECVGILVPPRGQWFCPGCRKARGLPT